MNDKTKAVGTVGEMAGSSTPNDEVRETMPWEDVVHFIAQGAINISEGGHKDEDPRNRRGCFIEVDSRIHKAMVSFCTHMCILGMDPKAKAVFERALAKR
ncbi:MAG: hypothetical protein ACYDH4_10775 [Candidatus Cryosericum sp.]